MVFNSGIDIDVGAISKTLGYLFIIEVFAFSIIQAHGRSYEVVLIWGRGLM